MALIAFFEKDFKNKVKMQVSMFEFTKNKKVNQCDKFNMLGNT
jgi:hypothetical protein